MTTGEHDDLRASLLARGFDPDAAALIQSAPRDRRFHESTVEEVRARDRVEKRPAVPGIDLHSVADRELPGPFGPVPVRVYTPSPPVGRLLPVLVYLHGGGWMIGSVDTHDSSCRHLAAGAACVVVSVDYRLAPEHRFPTAIEESYSIAAWVVEHARELGADPGRVAIGGDSAGATMAAAICLMSRDRGGPGLVFQLLVYPQTEYAFDSPSMLENAFPPMNTPEDIRWFLDHYLRDPADRVDPRAMPGCATSHAGLPPALVLTGAFDILRDDGARYAERLKAAGVPTRYRCYPGVGHGFFNRLAQLARGREAMSDAVAALRDAYSL